MKRNTGSAQVCSAVSIDRCGQGDHKADAIHIASHTPEDTQRLGGSFGKSSPLFHSDKPNSSIAIVAMDVCAALVCEKGSNTPINAKEQARRDTDKASRSVQSSFPMLAS